MKLCIADNLNLMRQKSGYSLEALAEIISVSRQTIAKWEMGDSYPDLMNCMKLASLYKISLDELVNKPMREIQNSDFLSLDNKIGGVIDVSEEGTIMGFIGRNGAGKYISNSLKHPTAILNALA